MDGIIYEIRLVVEVPKDWTKDDTADWMGNVMDDQLDVKEHIMEVKYY